MWFWGGNHALMMTHRNPDNTKQTDVIKLQALSRNTGPE